MRIVARKTRRAWRVRGRPFTGPDPAISGQAFFFARLVAVAVLVVLAGFFAVVAAAAFTRFAGVAAAFFLGVKSSVSSRSA